MKLVIDIDEEVKKEIDNACTDMACAIVSVKDIIIADAIRKGVPIKPCEDAVSREQAIKQCGFGMTSLLVADCLRRLPPVIPERAKGEWIESEFDESVYCSECNAELENKYRFCPNCGADMRGSEQECQNE